MTVHSSEILSVPRSKDDARRFYNRVSRIYDYLTGSFERRFAEMALDRLEIAETESALEIGFGSGHCLPTIAESVGPTGRVCGLDISTGMLSIARGRLRRAGLASRVHLLSGDAARLPYIAGAFDAVFMAYTLELFDTPEIPAVLAEIARVLRPGGRLGVAGMSKEGGRSTMLRLYEWGHRRWPKYLDCRPIYVERSLVEAGYEIRGKEEVKLFGLPNEIVVAAKPSG